MKGYIELTDSLDRKCLIYVRESYKDVFQMMEEKYFITNQHV